MCKKLYFLVFSIGLFQMQGQQAGPELLYFVGSGSDTATLVIDFRQSSLYGQDSCYAWGVLFNQSISGESMLNTAAAADINLQVNISGGFLNDVIYGRKQGLGGMPDFWSTWDGASLDSLSLNAGISSTVSNGEVFAISYTDFSPAADTPGVPIPAYDPAALTFSRVNQWFGTGSDSAVLVVDFHKDDRAVYAWGYKFEDSITGSRLLNDLSNAITDLQVNATNFLNDIIYQSDSGIGGSPNFWGTYSATNYGNWYLNAGIGTFVKNGDFFGCSYTDFSPALRPRVPSNVAPAMGAQLYRTEHWVYPNPTRGKLYLPAGKGETYGIFDLSGTELDAGKVSENEMLDLRSFKPGIYLLQLGNSYQKIEVI